MVHERQADNRRLSARDHDLVAGLSLFEELGQVRLGGVHGVGRLHSANSGEERRASALELDSLV